MQRKSEQEKKYIYNSRVTGNTLDANRLLWNHTAGNLSISLLWNELISYSFFCQIQCLLSKVSTKFFCSVKKNVTVSFFSGCPSELSRKK